MKKIINIILLLILWFFITTDANQSVIVSATVWNTNSMPVITNINPSSNPRIIKINKTQTYKITVKDTDNSKLTYTITPKDGYTNTISWEIELLNNTWYINFLYLSPNNIPNWNYSYITLTINDGQNVLTQNLNLYIYN